jgi:hypothetical protein
MPMTCGFDALDLAVVRLPRSPTPAPGAGGVVPRGLTQPHKPSRFRRASPRPWCAGTAVSAAQVLSVSSTSAPVVVNRDLHRGSVLAAEREPCSSSTPNRWWDSPRSPGWQGAEL